MANFPVPVGEVVELPFTAFEEDGVTPLAGLVDGDWTKKLLLGPVASANPVTVTETSIAGTYVVSFEVDDEGTWYVEVAAPNEAIYGGYVQAGFVEFITSPTVVARTTECP